MAGHQVYDGLSMEEMRNVFDLIYSDVPKETFLAAGMHQIHRVKLRKCHDMLVKNLDTLPVTDSLFTAGILTTEDKNSITMGGNTLEDRTEDSWTSFPRKVQRRLWR